MFLWEFMHWVYFFSHICTCQIRQSVYWNCNQLKNSHYFSTNSIQTLNIFAFLIRAIFPLILYKPLTSLPHFCIQQNGYITSLLVHSHRGLIMIDNNTEHIQHAYSKLKKKKGCPLIWNSTLLQLEKATTWSFRINAHDEKIS